VDITDRFKGINKPTIDNVELGDFLFTDYHGELVLIPIHDKEEDRCSTRVGGNNTNISISRGYGEIIVIKPNGIYLIGAKLKNNCISNCVEYRIKIDSFVKNKQLEQNVDLPKSPLDFAEPTSDNVELGDFLVRVRERSRLVILPIVNKDNHQIWATNGDYGNTVEYNQTIVFKQGRCLIGKDIKESYKQMLDYGAMALRIDTEYKLFEERKAQELASHPQRFGQKIVKGIEDFWEVLFS